MRKNEKKGMRNREQKKENNEKENNTVDIKTEYFFLWKPLQFLNT